MRILHLGKYYPPAHGGMERFLGDLAEEQRRAGDQPTVLVHAHAGAQPAEDPPWVIRCPTWLRFVFAPLNPLYPFWLARAIRTQRPDVLHIHMPNVSPFWALLLPAARRMPWIVQWHSDVEPSRFKRSLRLLYPYYRIFERAMLEAAACVVVASPQYLEASKPLAPWRYKCRVVPLGVDPRRLPEVVDARTPQWNAAGLRVLAAGRLTYYKGFETLVRAMARVPEAQLLIVGEGEERHALELAIAESGSGERVRLLGEVDDSTLHALLASCEVFCLPSRERTEAFGIVLVEAMRYAKPLLVGALAGSGVAFVAREGVNAMHVPPEDVGAWADALRETARDATRRRALGEAGYRRYREEFGIDRAARALRTAYALALRTEALGASSVPAWRAAAMATHPAAGAKGLLVVIPALDEADCIGEVIAQVRAQGFDALVVDDGSTDDTAAVARSSGARVLRAPLWQGAWGAIQTGIRYALRAGYSGVVTMDADGQHEPAHLPALVEAARHAEVVIAACPSRGSRLRHVAWSYFRFLTGFGLEDLTSGFRYYSARACEILAAEEATLLDYQDIGVLLLIRRARLAIAEVPVAMNPRRSGASRVFFSWWTVARYMMETSLLCLARWNPRHR